MFIILNSTAFSQWVWNTQTIETSGKLSSVYFINYNSGWTVGDRGKILKTVDGGTNWSNYYGGYYEDFYDVFFLDNNTGWIAGINGILKTTNGGANWNDLSSGTGADVSVFFIDSNIGWTVGAWGNVFKTTNGGLNWISQISGTSLSLQSVRFTDSNTGWIAGGGPSNGLGILLKTTNGGTNWISQNIGVHNELHSIQFTDKDNGWVVGSRGYRFKTTNGGTNWINFRNSFDDYLSVNFVNKNTGWLVGDKILRTTNGGFYWNTELIITINGLSSGFFIDENIGWAVGVNSTGQRGLICKRNGPNDVGITSIISPVRDSTYYTGCYNHGTVTPKVTIKNFGTNSQNSLFDVHFEIIRDNDIVYSNIVQDTISAGQTHNLSFDKYVIDSYTFGDDLYKTFSVRSWTSLPADINLANDTSYSSFNILYPNYGSSVVSGYYFLNSSEGANCIPDQPVFAWEDTTGSTSLYCNGIPVFPFAAGDHRNGCFLLPDVFPDGNKFRFFGTCYDTITISTNGIIGLGSSLNGMLNQSPVPLPSLSAAAPAIFPFWFGFDQDDGDLFSMNIKYKISGDKFIITYDRIPTGPRNIFIDDYVSYQVILETAIDGGTENGSIIVQFDTSKCGSAFLSNYYCGKLDTNSVGIQNSTGTVGIQYRYANSSGVKNIAGPLFGSPMALRFAQINDLLPVEYESFTSSVKLNSVNLFWKVMSESNNSGFEIERSNVTIQNSDLWSNIGFVNGNGTTTEPKQYSFTDKNLQTGKYKYRLKQIDLNGNFEYFELAEEVNIGVPDKFNLSQNYPNPFNPVTGIDYNLPDDGIVTIKVYDIIGREVKTLVNEMKTAGFYKLQFNASDLSSGVYFYRMTAGEYNSVKKFVVMK